MSPRALLYTRVGNLSHCNSSLYVKLPKPGRIFVARLWTPSSASTDLTLYGLQPCMGFSRVNTCKLMPIRQIVFKPIICNSANTVVIQLEQKNFVIYGIKGFLQMKVNSNYMPIVIQMFQNVINYIDQSCREVEWFFLKPNWYLCKIWLTSRCLDNLFVITFSNNLSNILRREIGL